MEVVSNQSGLFAIATLAIAVDELEAKRKLAGAALGAGYEDWKDARGLMHVARDSPDWDEMLQATKALYELWLDAKRLERNGRRRLATAIRKHRDSVTPVRHLLRLVGNGERAQ